MPLFDLKCKQCAHVFETLCSAKDWEEGHVPCPSCAHKGLERAYARPAGVVVKASAAASCPSSGMACPRAGNCGGH
jgi:putative FmdB family regulatory protein